MSKLKLNIVIVGAGNVAWHLAKELQKKDQKILQVYNRSVEPAISLSQRLNCDFTTRIEDINENADLYILTVKDSVIEEVSELIKIKNKLIVHTSGAVEQNVIKHNNSTQNRINNLNGVEKDKKLTRIITKISRP